MSIDQMVRPQRQRRKARSNINKSIMLIVTSESMEMILTVAQSASDLSKRIYTSAENQLVLSFRT